MARGEAAAIVNHAPDRLRALVRPGHQQLRHPDLQWSVCGYVCHVGDSIRIWSERIATVALGADGPVAIYSQDLLATARHYDDVRIDAALWSLERAVGDWRAALALVDDDETFAMLHEEMGAMRLDDVVTIRAHDVVHHTYDIARILEFVRE